MLGIIRPIPNPWACVSGIGRAYRSTRLVLLEHGCVLAYKAGNAASNGATPHTAMLVRVIASQTFTVTYTGKPAFSQPALQ